MLSTEFNIEDAKLIWKQEAFEDGMEQGIQRGMEQGMEQGIIKGTVDTLKSFNLSIDDIIKKVSEQYNLTKEQVKKYL